MVSASTAYSRSGEKQAVLIPSPWGTQWPWQLCLHPQDEAAESFMLLVCAAEDGASFMDQRALRSVLAGFAVVFYCTEGRWPVHGSASELSKEVSFVLEIHGRGASACGGLFPFFFFLLLNLEIAIPPSSVCEGSKGFLSSLFVLLARQITSCLCMNWFLSKQWESLRERAFSI